MKKAFTLAEVLIALSVVAVVAVLTIPSVVGNYRNKMYSAALKQTISEISDATHSIIADEHADSFYNTTAGVKTSNLGSSCDAAILDDQTGSCYFLRKYFKVNIFCNGVSDTKCVPNDYVSTTGNNAGSLVGENCIVNEKGATICMTYGTPVAGISSITIDTNGKLKPNITGVDVFVLKINYDGSIVDWSNKISDCNAASGSSYGGAKDVAKYAAGCFSKVIQNGWVIE